MVPTRNEYQRAVQAIINERSKYRRRMRRTTERVRELQKVKKKVLQSKKRQFEQQKLANIEKMYQHNNTRKLYQTTQRKNSCLYHLCPRIRMVA